MDVWELIGLKEKAKPAIIQSNKPRELLLKFAPNGQIVWYDTEGEDFLNNGYLGNHVVFSIADYITQKMAVAPVNLYQVKNEGAYKEYKAKMKALGTDSKGVDRSIHLKQALQLRKKAMEEVADADIMYLFEKPNEYTTWAEFIAGYWIYKNIVGSSYMAGARSGTGDDPTSGPIRELWQLPAHKIMIETGGRGRLINNYSLQSNPSEKILAENVLQIRNFSPIYHTETDWLYGLSKLHAMRDKLQEYNEGTAAQVDMYQKRGIRDIVFPKGEGWNEDSADQAAAVRDAINNRIQQTGPGGVIANSVELGSIRVGLSPMELGILESQKVTKMDFCALFRVPAVLMGYDNTASSYNNLSESTKIAITNAVIPELEQLKDGLNSWLIPSWYDKKNYVLDFDYEVFPELQEETKETAEWMRKAGVFTVNEIRAALRYDASEEENADKIMVPSNVQLLDDVGVGSFEGGSIEEEESEE